MKHLPYTRRLFVGVAFEGTGWVSDVLSVANIYSAINSLFAVRISLYYKLLKKLVLTWFHFWTVENCLGGVFVVAAA